MSLGLAGRWRDAYTASDLVLMQPAHKIKARQHKTDEYSIELWFQGIYLGANQLVITRWKGQTSRRTDACCMGELDKYTVVKATDLILHQQQTASQPYKV
ncbi:hypothetical protein TESG_08533 [Trichophyton tonsurans CBS 112818]|uniref:Uncharacterized protein n=1 Tax=Trichophyton tonsurans (strain CBS 112818) TaxID=647933 RepID=F2S3P3_TRIT1|nr:hypothetical protein TESG_08533 [Trichophyton tonsurans CBS 112818]